MASTYYDASDKTVVDGDIAEAEDLNSVNTAVETGFELVEADLVTLEGESEFYADLAQKWAEEVEDTPVTVSPNTYSALHHAAKASTSASAASSSASAASTSASAASTSATNASNAQTAAETAQGLAETAQTAAETAETNAETAQTAAETAQGLAETAQTAAETAETNAETAQTAAEAAQTACEARVPYPIDTVNDEGSVSGAVALAVLTYDTFILTLTGAITITLTSMPVGRAVSIILVNGDEGVTWPSDVDWPGGTAPTFSAGTDRVVLQKITSSIVHGSLAGQSYA